MKKNFVLAMAVAIFAMAISVSAQKSANFSGKWSLDVAKSKLGDRNRIESQTMTVTQTASEIKIATESKMIASATSGPPPAPVAGGRPGGGGPQSYAYTIGKETKMDQQMGQNTVPVTLSAKADGSNLWLTRSFTFTGPNGDVTSMTKDSWSLGPDGKSLTVNRDSTRNGNTASTTMVYTKN